MNIPLIAEGYYEDLLVEMLRDETAQPKMRALIITGLENGEIKLKRVKEPTEPNP